MKTPDKIMEDNGIDIVNLKKDNFSLYNKIRKSMDEFTDQYYEWKIKKKEVKECCSQCKNNKI